MSEETHEFGDIEEQLESGPQMTTLSGDWRPLLFAGIALAIGGVLAIIFPFVTGISISVLLGAVLVLGGLVNVGHGISQMNWKGFVSQSLLGVLYAVAGIFLMANPVIGLTSLTLLLVGFFMLDGIIEIFLGLKLREEPNWGWLVASGVLSLVLASFILAEFPSSAVWAIGLLFGVNLLTTGLSFALFALGARETTEQETTPPVSKPGQA
ncbi:HdeD family acid-resistance protein [Haloarchaeobius sp. HME9146]|uniref:HdeD family acid-resistance protein n=1 Tax=Haloarchaeobius sp. HME9146 TaxID=2978732 RepID=UPI0021C1DCF0|nr:HdeD family acid-resistance protein [Haloarchaeobius sp. HME9146]MCT9098351.1 HdeD family acid-resistance protein [Haloarchaeobius sp. HME9146]